MKAAEAVSIEWEAGPTAGVGEQDLLDAGRKLVNEPGSGTLYVDEGDVDAAREAAAETLTGQYETGTALHFTLEPQEPPEQEELIGRAEALRQRPPWVWIGVEC